MEDTLELRLRKLLENFKYESSIGQMERKLMFHHIEALIKALIPFIEKEQDEACLSVGHSYERA